MNAAKLQKMIATGGVQLRKALGELGSELEKLERDVAALEAQGPLVAPPTSYRIVEKSHDDASTRG